MPKIKDTSEFSVTVVASKEGYKTVSTTETVKVNKANGSLILSSTSGTLTYPTSTSFTISGNTGTLSVSSNNTNIATASISGNTVTVKPGTTAGYNWIETNLKKIIEYDEVKADKIILALPFYTRKWKVNSNGELVEKPSVVSMLNIKIPNGVEKQWNEDLQQYYIEYADGKDTVKMWIEDGTSITSKVSLVSKYGLAGTSGWRKDMETSNVWTIINTELQKASN